MAEGVRTPERHLFELSRMSLLSQPPDPRLRPRPPRDPGTRRADGEKILLNFRKEREVPSASVPRTLSRVCCALLLPCVRTPRTLLVEGVRPSSLQASPTVQQLYLLCHKNSVPTGSEQLSSAAWHAKNELLAVSFHVEVIEKYGSHRQPSAAHTTRTQHVVWCSCGTLFGRTYYTLVG